MKHLKVWQKLGLLTIVTMIPFAVVTYKMTSSIDRLGVNFARQEHRGLDYYPALLTFVKDLQLHRGLSNASRLGDPSFKDALAVKRTEVEKDLANLDAVDRQLDGALHTTKKWSVLSRSCRDLLNEANSLSPEESFARYSRLIADGIALIADIGDQSGLTLDPAIESKHLVDVLIFQGPELMEAMANARGFGVGIAILKKRTPEQLDKLSRDSVLVEVLGEKVDDAIAKALESDESLKPKLETTARATSDAVLDAGAEIMALATAKDAADPVRYVASLSRSIDALVALEDRTSAALREVLVKRVERFQHDVLETLAWAGLGLLVVGGIAFFITRDVTAGLKNVIGVANQIAVGNLTAQTDLSRRKDEIGLLARAFDQMIAAAKSMAQVAERIAAGDLSAPIQARSDRDVLGAALTNMVDRLATLLGDVHRSGIQVNTSVNDIAATARQQQATASEIAATTSEIGATSKQISATSKELVEAMDEVSQVADQTAALAGTGQAGVTRMEETMRHVMEAAGSINAKLTVLNEKAGNINQVVTTITKVADQTNLLSLNAAIEAEKAGEYGRGFAVVATEIRRLADQTAVATYDIEQIVKEIQSAVSAGVMGMDKFSEEVRRGMNDVQQVGRQLSEIIQQVQALAPRVEAVNEGMQAQSTGAEQITQALSQLGEAAQQTVESLRQSSYAIDGLNQAANGMHSGVSRFKLAA